MADTALPDKRFGSNSGRIGREAELKAWLWLTRHGYDVFDNIFPNGPIDVVAVRIDDGSVLKLEVRKGTVTPDGVYYTRLSQQQILMGVQILLYRPDLDEFELLPPIDPKARSERPIVRKRYDPNAAAKARERAKHVW